MASRGTAIQAVLNEPSAAVVCVKPSGDCFYECIDRAFATGGLDVRNFEGVSCVGQQQDDGSQALRRTAAEAVDADIFEQFSMYHTAGLPDFGFMRKIQDVQSLKERMLVSGKSSGCGQCLWANEFEIGAVCRALQLTVLIVDSQSSGRGRFIAVGPPACDPAASNYFVVLHRTRREHFNLVTLLGGRAVFRRHELPTAIASVWNMTLSEQQAGADTAEIWEAGAQTDPPADKKAAFTAVAREGRSHSSSAAAARKRRHETDGVPPTPRAHALDAEAGGGQATGMNALPPDECNDDAVVDEYVAAQLQSGYVAAQLQSGSHLLRARASRHPLQPRQAAPRWDTAPEAERSVSRTAAQEHRKRRRKDYAD